MVERIYSVYLSISHVPADSRHYCKTLYFRCILISRFWNEEISLHFKLALSQCCPTSICQALDGQTEFSRVFNFAIFSYSRNLRKFDAREKCVLQYVVNESVL